MPSRHRIALPSFLHARIQGRDATPLLQDARHDEHDAHGETHEKRIHLDAEEIRGERGTGRDDHRRDGPVALDGTRQENRDRERQEDAAAAQRHREVRPEEHLRALVEHGDDSCDDDGREHETAREPEFRRTLRHIQHLAEDIAREHRADAEREPRRRADEREHDAAHRNAAEHDRLIGEQECRQREDGRHLGMRRMHVHADHRAGQADGQRDERSDECADRRRLRRRRGEDGLDVCLRADHADDDRDEVRQRHLHAAGEEVEPGVGGQRLMDLRLEEHRIAGCAARNQHAHPDDDHLEDAADARTLHAAEERIAGDKREQDARGRPERDGEDGRDDIDAWQAARDRAEKDAERGNDTREDAACPAVILHEILRDRLKRRAAQWARIKDAHDDEREPDADREPPGGQPDGRGELRRADRRAAADARAGNAAGDERHTGTASAETEALRRMDGTRRVNAAAEDNGDRRRNDDEL